MGFFVVRYSDREATSSQHEKKIGGPLGFVLGVLALPFLLIGMCFMATFAFAFALALPFLASRIQKMLRGNWRAPSEMDGSLETECPTCSRPMRVEAVEHEMRQRGPTEFVLHPVQRATCVGCRKDYRREAIGKIWSLWQK